MEKKINLLVRERKTQNRASVEFLNLSQSEKVMAFHQSFDQYAPTPLAVLDSLAARLGVAKVYVKDESYRFGLNAFKVLGGSYAIGRYLAGRIGVDICELPYSRMVSEEVRRQLGEITFVTATDGNHGRGVAWTANKLRQKSVVYMPKGSALRRLENIRAEGAQASITDLNYDEAVRLANADAREHGWVMIQDTAWEGYEDIPTWIMQGYTTMACEAYRQLSELNQKPTHIFIQVGVGSLAGAVQGFFAAAYQEDRPFTVVVEPDKADCIYRTAKADDGQIHIVTGDMDTIMAGLACGEPNRIGWEILRDYADALISCPDPLAAKGMRVLAAPSGRDPRVVSGESGAIGVGLLTELMTNPALASEREQLHLDAKSRVLCFSTEGDTDPENYQRIVWDGAYPSF